MRIKSAFLAMLASLALAVTASCSRETYKKINYLQDLDTQTSVQVKESGGIIVRPKDQISIVVSHRSPELAVMFNLMSLNSYNGGELAAGSGQQRILGYSVDSKGDIDFPVLGRLHVAGLNRWQVAELVKNELEGRNLLKDPVVTVEYLNFQISVLGDVSRPGTFGIKGDKVTLLEALSLAGDLSITGRRDNVRVIREADGRRSVYVLDLRSSEIFNSPAFYLCQNDVVLVTPNEMKAGQSTINENNLKSTAFWISLGSFLLSVTSLIVNIAK